MLHTLAIAVHAVSGTLAFIAGAAALRRGRWFDAYLVLLMVMTGSLLVAVADGWSGLDGATRIIFAALIGLAGVMVIRAVLARRLVPGRVGPPDAGPSAGYVDHVGFTLVSLFDAFVVVSVLRAGAPGFVVALAGIAVGIAGHFAIGGARRVLVVSTAAQAAMHSPVSTGASAASP